MGKARGVGARIAIIAALIGVAGFYLWHVLAYHQSQAKLKARISYLNNEIKGIETRLDTKSPAEFIKVIAELNVTWEKVNALETSRRTIISGASWMQRAFIKGVPDEWSQPVISNIKDVYLKLPSYFSQQAQNMVGDLEEAASRRVSGAAMRSMALSFRNDLKALNMIAEETSNIVRSHSIQNVRLKDSLSNNRKAQEIDKWLDVAFNAERQVIQKSQEAVSIAIQAANATYRLGQDAPSSEIRRALELWQRASHTAENAADFDNDPGTPPAYVIPILTPIFESTGTRLEGITSDINRNLIEVEAVYRQAVSDESNTFTGFARKVRRGTRMIAGNLMALGSAAAKSFDRLSGQLATDLQEGMSNAMNAAAMVADKGIQLYQESRKSDIQRFIESREGQYVIFGGLGLIVLIAILSGVLNRK